MASAIALPIGSDLRVDLDISIIDRKPLIVRRNSHLIRQNKNLQPIHICLIRHNRAIRLHRISSSRMNPGEGGANPYLSNPPVQILLQIRHHALHLQIRNQPAQIPLHKRNRQRDLPGDLQMIPLIALTLPAPCIARLSERRKRPHVRGRCGPEPNVSLIIRGAQEDVHSVRPIECVFLGFDVRDPFEVFIIRRQVAQEGLRRPQRVFEQGLRGGEVRDEGLSIACCGGDAVVCERTLDVRAGEEFFARCFVAEFAGLDEAPGWAVLVCDVGGDALTVFLRCWVCQSFDFSVGVVEEFSAFDIF